jgi:penicillin-binding protein 1A
MSDTLFGSSKRILLLLLTGSIISGIFAGLFIGFTRDLPQIRSLESFSPSAVTRVFSADRKLLAELFVEKRVPVGLERIPDDLKSALIATEDRKFYRHSGVDIKAIARAIVKDILAGEFVEGASTITQQLAKTLFLTPRKSIVRKIKEAVLAFQLERRYTKDEILWLYLNQIYLGSGAYGVESAARIYFGKSVSDLSLAECALIAGLPKSPSNYSPLINPQLAVKRRNTVLRQMAATGIIDAPTLAAALAEPLKLVQKSPESAQANYFTEFVKEKLEQELGPDDLYKKGLTVYTTLSSRLQAAAEQAVTRGTAALKKRRRQKDLTPAEPQSALVAIDIASGGILAMVGGVDFEKSPYNRATMARRQPGSAFKPIVYALAVERGFPQNRLILDAPIVFKRARNGQDWAPENFSLSFEGEMTLRRALAISANVPAVRLIEILGPASVADFGHQLGVDSALKPNLSLALGTSEVTLLELTAAYTVFANRGKLIKPYGVMEVVDRQGKISWRARPHKALVISRTGAAIVTDMLQNVIQTGTGRRAHTLGRPLAGKTGTTDAFKDAWFIGFSPTVAVGVWVGLDENETLGDRETGSRAALPIWVDFMQTVLNERPFAYFDRPDGVVQVTIDPVSGAVVPETDTAGQKALLRKDSLQGASS